MIGMAFRQITRRIREFVSSQILGADFQVGPPIDLEERARRILDPADTFVEEEEPSILAWLRARLPTASSSKAWIIELLPPLTWLRHYDLRWLGWDLLAGLTVSLVVVPQALSHASLAGLPSNLGLFTSFSGNAMYWIFGTSKDMVVGTTSVSSLLTHRVASHITHAAGGRYGIGQVAGALSASVGAVFLGVGLLRLGWFVEFIPNIPISAFMTASSFTMLSSQVPVLLGIEGINTEQPPYLVFIDIFHRWHQMRLDAVIGLCNLALLFLIQHVCTKMQVWNPRGKRFWKFANSLRMTFSLLLNATISALIHRYQTAGEVQFVVVGSVKRGFHKPELYIAGSPLIRMVLGQLPAVLCILMIGHVAISKAMGRMNDYVVNPSQELVALGAANLFSSIMGGYVCTGSFSSAAVVSTVGVRSPLAGLITAIMVALTVQYLGPLFLYIPKAALASLVVHASFRLLTPPQKLVMFWRLSPLEFCIWLTCVAVGVFVALETSVYVGILMSLVLLLYKLARADGVFLGTVRATRLDDDGTVPGSARPVYLPLNRHDATNPRLKVDSPYPGVFVYRFNDGLLYVNQARLLTLMSDHIRKTTRRGNLDDSEARQWSDTISRRLERGEGKGEMDAKPRLRAIVLDFGAVSGVDVTAVQGLIETRTLLRRHAWPDKAEWHFSNVRDATTRRRLASAGFGFPAGKTAAAAESLGGWKPAYSIAATLDETKEEADDDQEGQGGAAEDEQDSGCGCRESDGGQQGGGAKQKKKKKKAMMAAVTSVDRPYFHVDLVEALECATREAMRKDERDATAASDMSEEGSGHGVSRQGV